MIFTPFESTHRCDSNGIWALWGEPWIPCYSPNCMGCFGKYRIGWIVAISKPILTHSSPLDYPKSYLSNGVCDVKICPAVMELPQCAVPHRGTPWQLLPHTVLRLSCTLHHLVVLRISNLMHIRSCDLTQKCMS